MTELPRFYKVFIPETSSEALAIPLSFTEHLVDPLPEKAKLQGTGGRFWTVTLTKMRGGVYFKEGWPKFAVDHDLKSGEYLTFVYDGNHTFEVTVYGCLGSKETRAVAQTVELSDSDSESFPNACSFRQNPHQT